MHPAGRPQFSHAGIHQREASPPALPGLQRPRILAPQEILKRWSERPVGGMRKVIEQMVRELSPDELPPVLGVTGSPQLLRRNLAEM